MADAIAQAMTDAREQGLSAFNPADASVLSLPAGLADDAIDADREYLFSQVIGHAYAGGPLDLAQWSQAVDKLQHWVGESSSKLPPYAGGGSRNVGGVWYVNGQAWSASELYTLNRVNTLADIDRMTAESLNVIAANNQVAKALTELMEKMFRKYHDNQWELTNNPGFQHISKSWVDAVGTLDQEAITIIGRNVWTDGSEYISAEEGAPPLEYPVSFDRLLELAEKYIGPDSLIATMATEPDTLPDPGNDNTVGLNQDDFRALIDEVETIIGAFSSDNQVAQLRNETLFNTRSNLLEGLSAFLKGQQTTRSTLARNT
ncbi:MAG: hypothetical protein VW840_07740 [Gammaproteobacteria bacterium]